jgi:hypothetical protein
VRVAGVKVDAGGDERESDGEGGEFGAVAVEPASEDLDGLAGVAVVADEH